MISPQPFLNAARAALERGDLRACYEAAAMVLQSYPQNPQAGYFAGVALVRSGRAQDGQSLLRQSQRAMPRDVEVMLALGEAGLHTADFDGAAGWFGKAADMQARNATAWTGLAVAHKVRGRLEEAVEAGTRALELAPDRRNEVLEIVLSALIETGRTEELLRCLEPLLKKYPQDGNLLQLAIFPYLYAHPDPAPLAAMIRRLGGMLAQVFPPLWNGFDNPRDPKKRLRIGYVSREFLQRWAPRFIGPLIEFHDDAATEVFCYYQTVIPAERDGKRSARATWRDSTGLSETGFAKMVRADGIDVLVDLTGWIQGSRLGALAHRPAPVQATYLGFPATTGVPGVQYRIVDGVTDPAGYEAYASEELVRMPGCFLCPQPNLEPAVVPPPCVGGRGPTFGSFNALFKIGPEVLALWARVLKAVPESRLLLKNRSLEREAARQRTWGELEAVGVERGRVELRGETPSEEAHLLCYGEIDVALDPFPYSGTTTTFDALWMGVPVVTLLGRSHVSRVTASMLTASGFGEDVAKTGDEYVARCAALVGDSAALAGRRAGQREKVRASSLCDGPGFVGALEAKYREMWVRFCGS